MAHVHEGRRSASLHPSSNRKTSSHASRHHSYVPPRYSTDRSDNFIRPHVVTGSEPMVSQIEHLVVHQFYTTLHCLSTEPYKDFVTFWIIFNVWWETVLPNSLPKVPGNEFPDRSQKSKSVDSGVIGVTDLLPQLTHCLEVFESQRLG